VGGLLNGSVKSPEYCTSGVSVVTLSNSSSSSLSACLFSFFVEAAEEDLTCKDSLSCVVFGEEERQGRADTHAADVKERRSELIEPEESNEDELAAGDNEADKSFEEESTWSTAFKTTESEELAVDEA